MLLFRDCLHWHPEPKSQFKYMCLNEVRVVHSTPESFHLWARFLPMGIPWSCVWNVWATWPGSVWLLNWRLRSVAKVPRSEGYRWTSWHLQSVDVQYRRACDTEFLLHVAWPWRVGPDAFAYCPYCTGPLEAYNSSSSISLGLFKLAVSSHSPNFVPLLSRILSGCHLVPLDSRHLQDSSAPFFWPGFGDVMMDCYKGQWCHLDWFIPGSWNSVLIPFASHSLLFSSHFLTLSSVAFW